MKLVQLLSSAAAVALVAGAAQAQTATGAGEIVQTYASEFEGTIGAEATITVDTTAATGDFAGLGNGSQMRVTFDFTNLTFLETIDATDVTGVADANCDFTPVLGGGLGASSVTFETSATGANFKTCAQTRIFDFDLERTAAGTDGSVDVSYACTADCAGFTDFADPTITLVDEDDSYPAAGRTATAGATVTLPANGTTGGANTLGSVDFGFDNSFFIDDNGTTIGGGGVQAIAAGDAVASAVLAVSFPQGTDGIASVAVTGVAAACAEDAPNNRFTCAVTGAELDAIDGFGVISFTGDNTDPIAQQTPEVSIEVTPNGDYAVGNMAADALAPIEWDDGLNVDTPANNVFEWVSVRSSGGTDSVFRITGMPTDLTATGACVEVQAGRSNTTIANTGWQCAASSVSASQDGTWTAVVRSSDLNAALGAGEGNADIELRVRRDEAAGADNANNGDYVIRRVLARNGIVTGTGFDGNPTN